MSRATAAVVLALTAALAALVALPGPRPAGAAWVGGGSLPGLSTGRVWSVAVSPADAGVVLAGTDRGVYRSQDGGQHWSTTSFTQKRVWVVGFDLRQPSPAFAGTDGAGLLRSDDAGTTWNDDSRGLPARSVRSLAFGVSLIAVGTTNGVAASPDGTVWTPVGLAGYDIASLGVSANVPQPTLIAGADNAPAGAPGYLFRSVGPTAQWEKLAIPPTAVVSCVAASALPQAPAVRTLLACTNAGVYRSNDGGTLWQKTFPQGQDLSTSTLTTIAFSPVDPMLAYAGDDAGGSSGGALLRSPDGGLTFTPADEGIPAANREVYSLAVAPATPPLVVAAVDVPGKGGIVYAQTDATVPTPAATGAPEAPVALATVKPEPTISATPAPTATAPSPSPGGESRFRRFFQWPLPLAVELLTALAAVYLLLRWRQRRLHIEGPP